MRWGKRQICKIDNKLIDVESIKEEIGISCRIFWITFWSYDRLEELQNKPLTPHVLTIEGSSYIGYVRNISLMRKWGGGRNMIRFEFVVESNPPEEWICPKCGEFGMILKPIEKNGLLIQNCQFCDYIWYEKK